MNFLYEYTHDFVVHQWSSDGKKEHSYVFVGDRESSKDRADFTNAKLAKAHTMLKARIYKTDTVESLHYKIAKYCLDINDIADIYVWSLVNVNHDESQMFAQNLFKNELKLTKGYINTVTESLLGKTVYTTDLHELVFREDFHLGFKKMYKSLNYSYTDLNGFEVFVSPTPFARLNETTNWTKVKTLFKTQLHRYDSVELNFTRKHIALDPVYFKHNPLQFDIKVSKMIDYKMDMQQKFVETSNIISDLFERIELLTLRVLPLSHDLDIDLNTVYNISKTTFDIPIVVYKSKYTNTYKINKMSLMSMDNKQIELFEERESKHKDTSISRTNEALIYYVKLADNVFFYLLLNSNGSYKIKYKMHNALRMSMKDIRESFNKLRLIFDYIDNSQIKTLTPDVDIFNSEFVEVIDFNTNTVMTLKSKIQSKTFLNAIDKTPFFGNKQTSKKQIHSFQFIDTNNFHNVDTITNFLYMNAELDLKELLTKMQHFFKISEEEAKSLYEEHKSKLLLPITRKGKNIFAVRQYHTAVHVKLNILSDFSIRVYTSNTQDISYKYMILFYLIQFLTQEIKLGKYDKANALQATDDVATNDITFTDLQEWEGYINHDIDLDDILDGIDIPVINTEIDMENYDDILTDDIVEEQLSEGSSDSYRVNQDATSQVVDEKDVKRAVDKADYTTFVLYKLYEADSKLFRWKGISTKLNNYSSKCGNVNYRQPIVISKTEKALIDKTHPGSYTGVVQTGSTKELAERNFYICPKIWCRFGRVSITEDTYKKYGNKCPPPYNEEAMFFPPKDAKENYFINKNNQEAHYPSLLNENKHPNNLRLPCCGKKPFVEDVDVNETVKKRKTANYISNIDIDMFLNKNQYGNLPKILNTLLEQETQQCQGQINSQTKCFVRIGIENEKNSLFTALNTIFKKDFVKIVGEQFKVEEFVFLNGGNTLKRFSRSEHQLEILKPNFYNMFRRYFTNNMRYVNMFDLNEEYEYVKTNDVFTYDDKRSELSMALIREYMIFKAFINFKAYILEPDIEKDLDDIQHLLTFESTNKEQYNIWFLEIMSNDVFIINPKYYNIGDYFVPSKPNVLLLKIGHHFELIGYIAQKPNKDKLKEILIPTSKIQKIISQIRIEKSEHFEKLYSEKVTKYVLTNGLKCVGLIDRANDVEILEKEVSLSYNNVRSSRFMYVKDLKLRTRAIEHLKKDEALNLNLFLNSVDACFNNKNSEDVDYARELYKIAKLIASKKKIKDAIEVLNHSISNFVDKEKAFLLEAILNQNNINIKNNPNKKKLIHDLIHLPLRYIMSVNRLLIHERDHAEIQLSYEDIILKKLSHHHKNFTLNEFQAFEKSSDDIVTETEYIKLTRSDQVMRNEEMGGPTGSSRVDEKPSTSALANERVEWTIKRTTLKPVSIQKQFPEYEVIEENLTLHKLLRALRADNPVCTMDEFKSRLSDRIAIEYSKNKDGLLARYKNNPNSAMHKIGKKTSMQEYIQLIDNPEYHFSFFELDVLAQLSGYNVLIMGRGTSYTNNGLKLFNAKTDTYVLLFYLVDDKKHTFKPVASKNKKDLLFQTNDFTIEQLEIIKHSE